MSIWRLVVVSVFLLVPLLTLLGFGVYGLWLHEWGRVVSWSMLGSMIVGYLLMWYWQSRRQLLRPLEPGAPMHWTKRDRQAWEMVQARANSAADLSPEKLSDPAFYLETSRSMAEELAAFYHPQASDPVGRLTVPELLAAVELASHDLAEMIKRYVPGGHLLTIDSLRQARKMTDWYDTARNAYWLVSALFNPLNTAVRFAASQAGLAMPWGQIQKNLIAWFYASFVHRLGTYLIELQSGRLKVGAVRYRELLDLQEGKASTPKASPGAPEIEAEAPASPRVALALLGQVGVGKSSLINALLGEQKALTDSVPTPTGITRYELKVPNVGTELVLYDTPGYGQEGVDAPTMKRVQEAAREADFLLLVLHARSPAREADLEMLHKLREWFARHPELKEPPIMAVVTHIDLLSPAMEWAPPYNWRQPARPKEKSIHECMVVVNEQLGQYVVDAVPVCTAEGKVTGVEEDLLPAMTAGLGEARAVALLRCLHSEIDAGSVKKIFSQLFQSGKAAARQAWKSLKGGG